jgi:hypothetical protein
MEEFNLISRDKLGGNLWHTGEGQRVRKCSKPSHPASIKLARVTIGLAGQMNLSKIWDYGKIAKKCDRESISKIEMPMVVQLKWLENSLDKPVIPGSQENPPLQV